MLIFDGWLFQPGVGPMWKAKDQRHRGLVQQIKVRQAAFAVGWVWRLRWSCVMRVSDWIRSPAGGDLSCIWVGVM